MPNFQLVQGESVNVGVAGVNGAGQLVPALPVVDPVTGAYDAPTWTTSDATKVQIIPSPDGNICEVRGIALGTGVTVTATVPGPLTAVFTVDVVSNVPVSIAINPLLPVQNPGNIDQRQLSAGGRYLGLGYNSPPNS